jgi:hypothetical protein
MIFFSRRFEGINEDELVRTTRSFWNAFGQEGIDARMRWWFVLIFLEVAVSRLVEYSW